MAKKQSSREQAVTKLRQIEVLMGGGNLIGQICKEAGSTDVTYYCWRREHEGLRSDQAKRLKELERNNSRLSVLRLLPAKTRRSGVAA